MLISLLADGGIAWFTTLEFTLATFIWVVALGLGATGGVPTCLVVFCCLILASNGKVLRDSWVLLVRTEIIALAAAL